MSDQRKGPSVFISYSHQDGDAVLPLASHLARAGLRVWMDTKDLGAGMSIVETVSKAIENSDVYLVALSPAALSSKWVTHELNTALSLEITRGRPHVIPVLLSKVEVPAAIRGRLYVDLSGVKIREARRRLDQAIMERVPSLRLDNDAPSTPETRLDLASVVLELRTETSKYYGGPHGEAHSREEVDAEATELVRRLRRRAQGVLLNFVSVSEMDFTSPHPRFPNGEVTTSLRDTRGDFVGTIGRQAIVRVQVLNPDEGKLRELVSSKLSSLGVARATYEFLVAPEISNLAQLALEKLQKGYVILGWDREDGAEVELPDDLKLSVFCADDRIRVGIETAYAFQFEKRAKEFAVRDFVTWLIARSQAAVQPAVEADGPSRRR